MRIRLSEPRYHRDCHAVSLGDRCQGLAGGSALDGFRALVIGQLALAAELDAVRHRTFAGPLADQLALEFGNAGEQGREQAALRARRVPQRIAKRSERGAGLADAIDQVEQLAGRAAEPVQLGHHDDVARGQRGH
jgi:hypothetical protein